jgi:hypothetical protein
VSAPPVTSYTIELIDTDGVAVVELLMLLLLPLCVEDAGFVLVLVLVLLLRV